MQRKRCIAQTKHPKPRICLPDVKQHFILGSIYAAKYDDSTRRSDHHPTLKPGMNRSRLQIAKTDIVRHFDALPHRTLKLKEIRSILSKQRGFWRLAHNTTTEQFITFLQKHSKLTIAEFDFPQRAETCYVWGEVPLLSIVLSLRKNLHLSHYTAMRTHGLTEQVPHAIYVTDERTTRPPAAPRALDQAQIDAAFERPVRASKNRATHGDTTIYLLNGAHTDHLGVVNQATTAESGETINVRVTGLERTLIDITIKPMYAGGVFEVAKAFALAKERASVNKMLAMLRKLDFLYPYHQAIGYYLERAGYSSSQLDQVRRLPFVHDHYLTHDMGPTRYEPDWRLWVPQGF